MTQGTSNSQATKTYKMNASDDLNIDSDNDTSEFYFGPAVDVTRVGAIVTTAVVNAAGTVEVEVYKSTAGADTLLGTWVMTGTTTIAAGAVVLGACIKKDADGEVAEDGTRRYAGPLGPFQIPAGSSLKLKVTEPGDSGVVIPFVEYLQQPMVTGGNVLEVEI